MPPIRPRWRAAGRLEKTLLSYLGAEHLVVTGLTTDNCVLFTANDAYVRDFHLHVPRDCVAAIRARDGDQALGHMQRVLRADIRPSTALHLEALATHPGTGGAGMARSVGSSARSGRAASRTSGVAQRAAAP